MSITPTQTLPLTTPATIQPDLAAVCLFSLLGLTLTAALLSGVSPETISLLLTPLG